MAIIHQAVANAPAEESKLSSREVYSDKLRTRRKTWPRRSLSRAVLASWLTILLPDAVHDTACNKQLLDEVEHDIMNYQNRGLCYLPKPKASADNTETRF